MYFTSSFLSFSNSSTWEKNAYVHNMQNFTIFTYEALITQIKVVTL